LGRPLYFLEQAFSAMGSPCEVKLYADSRGRARHLAGRVMDEVARLERKYSRYREESFLSEINRVAQAGGSIAVDPETAGLLDYVAACWQQSEGLFDVTSGLLRRAWGFKGQSLPDPEFIKSLLRHVGWNRLSWEPPVLSFPEPGLELDLGGAVKEYAVDRVAALCWEAGIRHGLINLGGDIKVIGPHPNGNPWAIGIRHPRDPQGIARTVYLKRGALASSGDYERCLVVDGQRYGHVLNPRTGWPVSRLASVSVVAEFCVVAGSASTIAMLMEEEGPEWLNSLGVTHYWVDVDGEEGGNWS
jgi:thiamine biosynthesis lipoprotein